MDRLDSFWNQRFQELEDYERAHGHCSVPQTPGPCRLLGCWVGRQRMAKHQNKLSAEREAKLNSIGFFWNAKCCVDWNLRFQQLLEYKEEFGDCRVPRGFSPNPQLWQWAQTQRVANKLTMTKERREKLNSISFEWGEPQSIWIPPIKTKQPWEIRFAELEDYKKANGHCNVSRKDSHNVELGNWVSRQRQLKKRTQLSDERLAKLDSIGFAWDGICRASWNVRFQQLLAYKEAFGRFTPQAGDSHNVELANWLSQQRSKKKKNKLGAECEAKLDSIGFAWNEGCLTDWNLRFQQLLEYKEEFGDCQVPLGFSPNPQLGKWTYRQQRSNKLKKLTKERWEKLNSIRFDWGEQPSSLDDSWDTLFFELLAYLQTHGDFNVLQAYPRNPLLVRWVREQRNAYALKCRGEQTSSLTPLREAKLDAIGFSWFVGVTEEDYPAEGVLSTSASVRPEKVRSGNNLVRNENVSVASPDHITSE